MRCLLQIVILLGLMYIANTERDIPLYSFDFEVFGKVQGVYFRKFTLGKADGLGIVGWVKNSRTGTVVGQAQGKLDKLNKFQKWLETEGSPKSKISKLILTNVVELDMLEYTHLTIRN